mgnify:CR=1 FL=1
MEYQTKEFGIKVGNASIHRNKGKSYFSIAIKDDEGGFLDANVEPKDVRDLADALGIVITLADFIPVKQQIPE